MTEEALAPPELPKHKIDPRDISDQESPALENQSDRPINEASDRGKPIGELHNSLMSKDDPESPKKLPIHENSCGENHSNTDLIKEAADGNDGVGLMKAKGVEDRELRLSNVDAFENNQKIQPGSSQENQSDTHLQEGEVGDREESREDGDKIESEANWAVDSEELQLSGNAATFEMVQQIVELLQQNMELQRKQQALKEELTLKDTSLHNLVLVYDAVRRLNSGDNMIFTENREALDALTVAVQDPNWFREELSSLLEVNKILTQNREGLDGNIKKLILMLKIASSPDAPHRYDTSALGGQKLADEFKPYEAELKEINKAFKKEFESRVSRHLVEDMGGYIDILTEKPHSLFANIKKLITMLKITLKLESCPDTPDGYDVFTMDTKTMDEEIKPYAADLAEITKAFQSKNFESPKSSPAAAQKNRRIWGWLFTAAVASIAYISGYRMSTRLQSRMNSKRVTSDDGFRKFTRSKTGVLQMGWG